MTTPTAIELLAEVQRVGGWLMPKPPDKLTVDLPKPEAARLLPAITERKAELLRLLHGKDEPCPTGDGVYGWEDRTGRWCCGRCQPSEHDRRLRGVSLETLGNRAITLRAPTSDLPAIREWVRTPTGTGEVVLYSADGGEMLVRLFKGCRLAWYGRGDMEGELEWAARERKQ